MYHNYFGLTEQAFSIAVNPRYLYMSQQHKEALAHLLYGVKGGGFVLLSGEVGTGKTTIIKCLLEQLPKNTDIAIVLNPMAGVIDMLATICDELGAPYDKNKMSAKELTDSLHKYLLQNHTNGHNTVLLIDEAQLLSAEALEQIRLLTNLETTTQKLLHIILVGQPEINELLAQPRLRQLSQRITARFHLVPLTLAETQAYILHRLQVAGMPTGRSPYPPNIVRKIHRFTGGIPRLINIFCERLLIGAYGHNKPVIDRTIFNLARNEVAGSMEHIPTRHEKFSSGIIAAFVGACIATILGVVFIWPLLTNNESSNQLAVAAAPVDTVQPPTAPITQPTATVPDYYINTYSQAQFQLLTYLGLNTSMESHPCWELMEQHIQCKTQTLETWQAIQELNRPVVLVLTTPERFTSHVVITGLNSQVAEVLNKAGNTQRVPLSTLGPLWTGKVFYAWNRPQGFTEPLVLGQRSDAVRWLAEQFALMDDRQQPLTNNYFNRILQQRVKIFQRSQGLKDDGIVGEQTLMKVNEVLGIDKTLTLLQN